MDPSSFLRGSKLCRLQRPANEDGGVCDLLRHAVIAGELQDFDLRKVALQPRAHPRGGAPQVERMIVDNQDLHDFTTRKSCPVMSAGCVNPSIPKTVGEMSCKEPSGRNVNLFASSLITINGTGLVVCAVCGPPDTGSIIISALPWSAVTSIAPPRCRTEL